MDYRYISFFGYAAMRFAFTEEDSLTKENGFKKLSFSRNRLDLDIPNPVYVLSASAKYSMVKWEGYTVIQSAKPKDASGVQVYAYPCNSTKHKVEKEAWDFCKHCLSIIKTNGRKNICLALNKEVTQTKELKAAIQWLQRECVKLGCVVSIANRGSIIGRNDWLDSDCVIIAYGLFTSLSNVVLKASLAEGSPIEESRIWEHKESGVEWQPRMTKGLTDPALREIDRRMFADEVYQVGLRGVARNWQGDSQDVIVCAPSMDYVIPLLQVLNGAKIVYDKLDFSGIKTEDLLKNGNVLARLLKCPSNPDGRAKANDIAREILAARLA